MSNKSFWKNKKVLITGHTGFKGSWLSLWLLELGAKVSGIALSPNTNPSLFKLLELSNRLNDNYLEDIRNYSKLENIISKIEPDIVFHLAAQPLVRESYKDPLGTWSINVMGSLNILSSLSKLKKPCAVVIITTDKVYKNKEWEFGYRENDELGGYDPYSASKAASEIAIESWRSSFCKKSKMHKPNLNIATARSGNVIGGGDWSKDRIIPDAVQALSKNKSILTRNPDSTRPWQHVIEPLSGYLILAEKLFINNSLDNTIEINPFSDSFNFGPNLDSNKKVSELLDQLLIYWPGKWQRQEELSILHETKLLNLNIDKSYKVLRWTPKWNFDITIKRTTKWYRDFYQNKNSAYSLCLDDLYYYNNF